MLNGFKSPGRVALIGSRSDIGVSIIKQLPEDSSREVILIGRSGDYELNVTDKGARERVVAQLFDAGDVDLVVIAVGLLGKDPQLSTSENLLAAIDVNFLSSAHLMELISERMRRQAHGAILIVSSFAQVRPRDDNFRYGSTKAGIDFYARGLASSLQGSGVSVKILRPGFVKSKMTEGMEVAPLAITAEECGKYGVAALSSKKVVTWAPSKLKYAAVIFKALPPSLFKKISQR